MLETIRAYATERLATTDDNEAVRERHHRHYVALAQRHGTEPALWGANRDEHLARLDAEIDNLDEALRFALAQSSAEPGTHGGERDHGVLADAKPSCGRGDLDRPGLEQARG